MKFFPSVLAIYDVTSFSDSSGCKRVKQQTDCAFMQKSETFSTVMVNFALKLKTRPTFTVRFIQCVFLFFSGKDGAVGGFPTEEGKRET